MARHQQALGRAAAGERTAIVVDPSGKLAALLLRQRARAAELREDGDGLRDFGAAPPWLDSVAAWRVETTRMLAAWFEREVVAEFERATSPGQESDALAERVRSTRTALRDGTELVRALYSTQTAHRQTARSVPSADAGLSEPRQVA